MNYKLKEVTHRIFLIIVFFLVSQTLLLPESFAQLQDSKSILEPVTIPAKIKEKILQQDINFSIDLLEFDIVNGINISTAYKYRVEPSYQDNYYSRIDRYVVTSDINVGDLIKDVIDDPFFIRVERGKELFFVRQFKTKKEASFAKPYSITRIPLTAERARKNLQVGDFASIPARLNILVGLGTSSSSTPVGGIGVDAGASLAYVISGEFNIQIFKVDENRVRLKLISTRGNSKQLTGNAEAGVNIFSVNFLNRQIKRIFDNDLLSLGVSYNPGAQFIVDYVFDLSTQEGSLAYNQILNSTYKFKDIMTLGDSNAEELKQSLITTYQLADKYANEDKENCKKRVIRLFKGTNNFNGKANNLKFGFILASYKQDTSFVENKITFYNKNEQPLKFFYPVHSKYFENKYGVKFFNANEQSHMDLFGLIPFFEEDAYDLSSDLGFLYERLDKVLTKIDLLDLRKIVFSQIPEGIRNHIPWDHWKEVERKLNAKIYVQMIIKSYAFELLAEYSREELTKRLREYVYGHRYLETYKPVENINKIIKTIGLEKPYLDYQIKKVSKKLHYILTSPDFTPRERIVQLLSLRSYKLYETFGVGFLISLLPENRLEQYVYLKLELQAQGTKEVKYTFGTLEYKELYDQLYLMQSRLNNRSFDLRPRKDGYSENDSATDTCEENNNI